MIQHSASRPLCGQGNGSGNVPFGELRLYVLLVVRPCRKCFAELGDDRGSRSSTRSTCLGPIYGIVKIQQ